MDKEIVTDYGNLYYAYRKAKSGKKFNSSTARFSNVALDGINILKEQLENQTYTVAPYNRFEIYEPKQRVIESCSFKDKVVQHILCDNILHPKLKNVFIKKQWKADHEKNPIETKWVWYVKIIEADTHLLKHEELLKTDFSIPMDKRKEEILKKYCSEHDGKYYAISERRCVVKE